MGDQVVGGDQDLAAPRPRRSCRRGCGRAGGAPAGCGRGRAHSWPSSRGVGHLDLRAPAAEAARDAAQRHRHLLGDAVAQHQPDREAVLGLGVLVEVGEPLGGDPQRRDLRPGAPRDDLGQAEVVDVLVGDDEQLELLDRAAALGQLRLQLVERLARVRPGVDQGQRLVLDQIAVDPPDREGRGNAQAVDPGQRRLLERLLGGHGHARISPSSSSRLASMSSRETSDSRLRRSSGSVLEGRTLKCHSA